MNGRTWPVFFVPPFFSFFFGFLHVWPVWHVLSLFLSDDAWFGKKFVQYSGGVLLCGELGRLVDLWPYLSRYLPQVVMSSCGFNSAPQLRVWEKELLKTQPRLHQLC